MSGIETGAKREETQEEREEREMAEQVNAAYMVRNAEYELNSRLIPKRATYLRKLYEELVRLGFTQNEAFSLVAATMGH